MAPGVLFLFGFWNKNALHMHYYTLPQRDQDQELLSLLVNKYTLDIKQLQDDEVLDLTFHERRKREKRAQKLLRGLELLHRLSNKKRNFAMGFFLALYHRPKKLNHSALTEYEPCKSPFAAADDLQLLESTRLNGQKIKNIAPFAHALEAIEDYKKHVYKKRNGEVELEKDSKMPIG